MAHSAGPSIRGLLEARGLADPERCAFVEGASGRRLTWGVIANTLVGWQEVGALVEPGHRVGLRIADPLEMARAYLAALGAGVLVAPLDPGSTPVELAAQARRLGLTDIVTDEREELAEGTNPRQWRIAASTPGPVAVSGRNRTRAFASSPTPGRAAMILSSSGTTGEPKIIPLSAQQLLATAEAVAEGHGLGDGDIGYSPLPLSHINGLVVGLLSTLVTGGSLVVDARFSAGRFWEVVCNEGVTWLNLVPAIISVLSDLPSPPAALSQKVLFARSASAPLPEATRRRFEQRCGIGVLETYGMTEAASQITANPRDPASRRPGSVGQAVAVELRVVDRTQRPLVAGGVGEVMIRGARIIERYWAPAPAGPGSDEWRAEERPATDHDGWLGTGDLGRVDDHGFVYLVGRVDDVINRGGEKVYPREVEEVLLADPEVIAAAVVGRPHPVIGEEPVAYVLAATNHRDSAGGPAVPTETAALVERLRISCCSQLSRFKRPVEIVLTDSLPLGPNGKIRRVELRGALTTPPPPGNWPPGDWPPGDSPPAVTAHAAFAPAGADPAASDPAASGGPRRRRSPLSGDGRPPARPKGS